MEFWSSEIYSVWQGVGQGLLSLINPTRVVPLSSESICVRISNDRVNSFFNLPINH